MNLCPDYKKLRRYLSRTVINWLMIIIVIILTLEVVGGILDAFSMWDRKELHLAQEKIARNQLEIERLQAEAVERERVNQLMLTARKEIQARGIFSMQRAKMWSEEDKRIIANNWDDAQYWGVQNPFPEYLDK